MSGGAVSSDFFSQTPVPARESEVWRTPMFEQYWKNRELVPEDTLLFYRMGDFYELFGRDAVIAAPVMEVQLTARNKEADVPVPMCGVPAFAVDSYAEKLLARGIKVALCEQLQDPAELKAAGVKTKLVERGIIRILTPGLPVDLSRMDSKSPHYLLALSMKAKSAQAVAYDFLGMELFAGDLGSPEELNELLARVNPKEILVPSETLQSLKLVSEWRFLDVSSPWYSKITPWAARDARQMLEEYLVYTQRVSEHELAKLLPDAKDLRLISGMAMNDRARIPVAVLEQWAVFPQLFELLNGAGSAMGSRRLREILGNPLKSVSRLQKRQTFFESLHQSKDVLSLSRELYDLERLLGRFRVGVAAPKELVQLAQSLNIAMKMVNLFDSDSSVLNEFYASEGLRPLATLRTEMLPLVELLGRMLNTEIDLSRNETLAELLRPGFDEELDRLKHLFSEGESWIQSLEDRLRVETQIPSLKVRYNRVFGYYIEITKVHLSKVPAHFERKQTTVGGERFTIGELRNKERDILTASARSEARAKELIEGAQREVLSRGVLLKEFFGQVAWLDALSGVREKLNALRRFGPWVMGTVEEGPFAFSMVEARHPVIEAGLRDFVANSLELGVGRSRLLLLTGPNMAGKSTLMRQSGLVLLLAQCGLPVPATSLRFSPCSGFFSRMGASDRILDGESTFMVEMKETSQILREADENSLVLIDEIGRGTSTEDGLSIAQSVLEHLHSKTQALCIFATHYHELSEVALTLEHARNASMEIQESKGDLNFLRKLKFVAAQNSYGIFVAKLAGLPKTLLSRAQTLFEQREVSNRLQEAGGGAPQGDLFSAGGSSAAEQNSRLLQDAGPSGVSRSSELFGEMSEEILQLDLNDISPRQAWEKLENLQKSLRANADV
jgi:DNA mismatch repair protein MutS